MNQEKEEQQVLDRFLLLVAQTEVNLLMRAISDREKSMKRCLKDDAVGHRRETEEGASRGQDSR